MISFGTIRSRTSTSEFGGICTKDHTGRWRLGRIRREKPSAGSYLPARSGEPKEHKHLQPFQLHINRRTRTEIPGTAETQLHI
jgi:hypothetical protein